MWPPPLRKVPRQHAFNTDSPLKCGHPSTLSLVPRVAGLEGFHCIYIIYYRNAKHTSIHALDSIGYITP